MEDNIVTFMKGVNQGQISTSNFLKGLSEFSEQLQNLTQEGSSGDLSQTQLRNDETEHDMYLAIKSFVELTVKTCQKQLPSDLFLNTPFSYKKCQAEFESGPQQALLDGMNSLLGIHLRIPAPNPLQRWAYIAIAANFSGRYQHFAKDTMDLYDVVQDLWQIPTADAAEDSASREHAAQPIEHNRPPSSEDIEKSPNTSGSYPLGLMVELFYGVQEDLIEESHLPGYSRAFANWNTLLQNFVSASRNQQFMASLSTSQVSSARILLEWWSGKIENNAMSKKSFQALERAAIAGLLDDDFFEFLKISKHARAEEERQYYQQRHIFDSSAPPYPRFMFLLYQQEFLPYHYHKVLSTRVLQLVRNQAAKQAACQRVAISCYRSLLKQYILDPTVSSKSTQSAKNNDHAMGEDKVIIIDRNHAMYHTNQSLTDGTEIKDVKSEPETEEAMKVAVDKGPLVEEPGRFSKDELGLKVNAIISSCPWLGDIDAQDELPHYLWDIAQKCTILAEKLKGEVEYTAISHTWGRWIKDTLPPAQVDGVENWRIPENSKFEVRELPKILASFPVSTPYLWFDLVCIPQSPSDVDLKAISKREIGRQAKIFRRAKVVVAWFNEIENWRGLEAAIQRLSIHYLQEGNDDEFFKPVLDIVMAGTDLPLELFDSSSAHDTAPEDSINGWFSSLWTLQEICLRPDMRLCSRNWEILGVGENRETIVGMDDLVALAVGGNFASTSQLMDANTLGPGQEGELQSRDSQDRTWVRSKATEHLWELLDLSGLDHLLNASRTTILMLGNQRHCKENRAEAIMSAIGVTDWHTHHEGLTENTEFLGVSLDQYPLAFVREAAKKIGADFYAFAPSGGELLDMLVLSLVLGEGPRKAVGSMLPFTSSLLSRDPSLAEGMTGDDHPAVSTWKILPDGSVEISKVGIVSYTGQRHDPNRNLICTLMAPYLEEPASLIIDKRTDMDLDVWVDSFIPTTQNFAVCLHHGLGIVDGLLLKQISSSELVKVGTYHVSNKNAYQTVIPITFKVKWRIL